MAEARIHSRNLTRKATLIMLYNLVGAALGYATLFFVYRYTGRTAYGIVGSALAFAGILSFIGNFGFNYAHIKRVTEGRDFGECTGTFFGVKMLLTGIYLAVGFGALVVWKGVLGYGFETPHLETAIEVMLLYNVLVFMQDVFRVTFSAQIKTKHATLPLFVELAVRDSLLVLFSLRMFIDPSMTLEEIGLHFTLAYVYAAFASLLCYAWMGRNVPFSRPRLNLARDYWKFAAPLFMAGMISLIIANTDRLMLQYFWSVEEVGAYFGLQRLVYFITQIGGAVATVSFPAAAHHLARMNRDEMVRIFRKSEKYLSLLVSPLVVALIVFPEEILNLWSVQLVPYANTLRILALYAYAVPAIIPYRVAFNAAGRPKENTKVWTIQLGLNVVLNALLIPSSLFGIPLPGLKTMGAALATFLSFLTGVVVLGYHVSRKLGVRPDLKRHLFLGVALLAAVPFYLLSFTVDLRPFMALAAALVAYLSTYAVLTTVLRLTTYDEIRDTVMNLIRGSR